MRVFGSTTVILSVLLGLALWLIVKDTTETKIVVEIAFVVLAVIAIAVVSVAVACTVAQVEEGRLDFYFCGVKTQSFALDGNTVFDLHKIGRLEILRIWRLTVLPTGALDKEKFAAFIREPTRYVPSGALDRLALVDLLRANGVAERQAD